MPSDPQLLPDVRYRIQSVDFGTFLERRNDEDVVLRPIKTTLQQQWLFSKDDLSSTYQISNAADTDYVLDATPFTNVPGSRVVCQERPYAQAMRWRLTYGRSSNVDNGLYIVSADVGRNNVLLNSDMSGLSTLMADANIRGIRTIEKEDDFRWKILEDCPASLPEGDISADHDRRYLIRTLNGDAVHSESGKKPLYIKDKNKGPHREWEIKSFGNGKCTIKNVQENAFLVADKIDDRWEPVLAQSQGADKWDVQYLGNLSYTICIKPTTSGTDTTRRYSLSLKEDIVVLRDMNVAHNQIWHIEAKTASLDQSDPEHPIQPESGTQTGSTPQAGSMPQVGSTQRREIIQTLLEGEYYLRHNGNNNNFLYSNGAYATIKQNQGVNFLFELADDVAAGSGQVYISFKATSAPKLYLGIETGSPPYARLYDHKSRWALSIVQNTTPTQFILTFPGFGGLGVISNDGTYARMGGSQSWTFIPKTP